MRSLDHSDDISADDPLGDSEGVSMGPHCDVTEAEYQKVTLGNLAPRRRAPDGNLAGC